MKNTGLLLFLSTLFFTLSSFGCQRKSSISFNDLVYEGTTPIQKDQYVFKVYFHVIRNSRGEQFFTNDIGARLDTVSEETILDAVALLNKTYNQFDIFFKFKGFGYIDNSTLRDLSNTGFANELNATLNKQIDAFNIYITNTVNIGTTDEKGKTQSGENYSAIARECLLTAALPNLMAQHFSLRPDINWEAAVPYDVKTIFTEEQGRSMRENIADDVNDNLGAVATNIESLYFAYAGRLPGGAYSERAVYTPPKFQKGFDYLFVDCRDHSRVILSYTKEQTPIGHPRNAAIKILQVSKEIALNCPPMYP